MQQKVQVLLIIILKEKNYLGYITIHGQLPLYFPSLLYNELFLRYASKTVVLCRLRVSPSRALPGWLWGGLHWTTVLSGTRGWGVSPGAHPEGLEASHPAAEEDTPPLLGPRPLPEGPGAQNPPCPQSLRTQPCPPACRAERGPAAACGRRGAVSPPCWEPGDSSGSRR